MRIVVKYKRRRWWFPFFAYKKELQILVNSEKDISVAGEDNFLNVKVDDGDTISGNWIENIGRNGVNHSISIN